MTHLGADETRTFALRDRPGERFTLTWSAVSDTGYRRAVNEDSVIVVPPVFAVADGMGGHAAGDKASDAVIVRLAELKDRDDVGADDVGGLLVSAAEDIDALAVDIPIGAGTTVTGAFLNLTGSEPAFTIFNVGDSRVYRFARNELVQVTTDHSVVQELVAAGRLRAEDAEHHRESNVITRALGFREQPRPDYFTVPARTGMRLLMCSDGLTKEVGHERIRLHLAAGMPASETAAALVDAALATGGRDNVTVVVVDVVEAPSGGRA